MKKHNIYWKIMILTVGAALLTIPAVHSDYKMSLVIGLLTVCAMFYASRKSRSRKQEAAVTADWTMQQPFLFAEQPGTRERAAETDEVENPFEAVARDLRKLAEFTAQSASQISRNAHTIKAGNEKVMISMQEAAERLKQTTSEADRASESLRSIRKSVVHASDPISAASRSKSSTSSPFAEIENTMLM